MGVATVLDAEDIDDLAEGDELGEDPRQLQELVFAEARSELLPHRVVHRVVVGEEPIGVAERRLLALGEGPALVVAEGRDYLLRDAFAPSQGVARGHSVAAIVELREPEAGELLGAMLDEPPAHERRVEGYEARERLRQPGERQDEVRIAPVGLPLLEHETQLGRKRGGLEERQSWHGSGPGARAPSRSRRRRTR